MSMLVQASKGGTKMEAIEVVSREAKKLHEEGMTFKNIDLKLGFPPQWGGRASWILANRPGARARNGSGNGNGSRSVAQASPQNVDIAEKTPEKRKRFCETCGRRFNRTQAKRKK